jgi:CheY-like chemotaxis protein
MDASPVKEDGVTVLVVEDEALIRLVVVEQLHGRGYQTFEAASASEAIEILERTPGISAAIIDIDMPGSMNGLLLARYVSKAWPGITILISSGQVEAVPDQMPHGAVFLPKPHRMADMQRAYAAIERHRD